ncbi:MAG: polyphosphate kinase 1 [Opitutaceae bacterium]|nr:polyphosphate kinase 1 [Opitutaceae bacterium]
MARRASSSTKKRRKARRLPPNPALWVVEPDNRAAPVPAATNAAAVAVPAAAAALSATTTAPAAAAPGDGAAAAPARPAKCAYFNRELSWLAFNRRVLEQARNEKNPLLERVRFLAIVSSNLDEFFEIRVAGIIQQVESGVTEPTADGLSPGEALRRVHSVVASLVEEQYHCWHKQLVPALAREGIFIKPALGLDARELAWARNYFEEQVLPVVTPVGIDQSHPFPQLGNKTLNVVVRLDDPRAPEVPPRTAILPVPRILPRLVRLCPGEDGPRRFVFLSEIIKLCAGVFFPGYRVRNASAFRVTRNSDLYIDDEEAENLLQRIEEQLRQRRRGAAVRLEIEDNVPDPIFDALCAHLDLAREYVFRLHGPLNLLRLLGLADIDRPDLKFPAFTPVNASPLRAAENIFDIIRAQDVLLHHPYDSFQPVVDFVGQAARDPQVFAIKQTLYRTSGDSPIVSALIEASRNGKQVAALVELKARFDEANNIQWARQLEEAGVHVVYGLVGHKTHCKCSLVVRREGAGLRRYVHLGTGNYNPKTARLYTDLSLFTAAPHLTGDAANLFNSLTGFSLAPGFAHLLVAPYNLHRRIQELIQAEAARAAAGKPARIIAKMNSLVDKETIDNLYLASRAGVRVDLIVRGICCLVPGIRGLSENIRVRSIVGRYLEHARACYFENHGAGPLIYAGSADWMPRNFFRRVEVLFPIESPPLRRWIMEEFFPPELRDNENARILHPNGSYLPPERAAPGEPGFSTQACSMARALQRAQAQAHPPVAST